LTGKAKERIEKLETENARLRESLEYLKAEDKRKAKVIDKLLG
jgi:predicted nuclease with TOPRIM domain